MHPLFTDAYNALLQALLPVRCVVCTQEAPEALCATCLNLLSPARDQRCPVCHKPNLAGLTHPACGHMHPLDQLLSLYDYTDTRVSKLIIAGKYKFVPDAFHIVAPGLSRLVTQYLELDATRTLVTPLPLHRFRERWRGFNQAAILARRVATDLNIPFAEVLIRHRRTRTQKDLKRADRLTNVAHCFSHTSRVDIQHTTILLIDDVTTSGSTLQEAAKVLKQQGAVKVVGITLARD